MFASNIVIQLPTDSDQLWVQLPVNELCPSDFCLPIYLNDAWTLSLKEMGNFVLWYKDEIYPLQTTNTIPVTVNSK